VLWDVGANVGPYALYAALGDGVRVVAFEPAAASYAVLCHNIELNRMAGRIAAYPIALARRTGLDVLHMTGTGAGGSMHAFGTTTNVYGEDVSGGFAQAAIGMAADDFLRQFAPPPPTHLKIDVDSIEVEIIEGARAVLALPTVVSVWVETVGPPEAPRNAEIAAALAASGFRPLDRADPAYRNTEFRRG
jgi:FkbM family methyltransferase